MPASVKSHVAMMVLCITEPLSAIGPKAENHPVNFVSWFDARHLPSGGDFREAEWEYGTQSG